MEAEFQYKLSNIDMTDLYSDLLCYFTEFPEIMVLDDLPDNNDIMCRLMLNGRYMYYLKKSENMIDLLKRELAEPSCRCYPALPFEYHKMDGSDIAKWISCALEISELLQVRCPQIMFTEGDDAGTAAGEGLMILSDHSSDIEMFVCIAHELRHEWQSLHHPEWNEDYVRNVETEDDMQMYLNHIAEIDAEAFARKIAGAVFGIDLFKTADSKLTKKLKKQAEQIELKISEESLEFLYSILFEEDFDEE